MGDAAVKQLLELISEDRSNKGDHNPHDKKWFQPRKPTVELHFSLAEGWFSLVLLATVVYSTIWCVQAVGWVEHLNILSLTTALGLGIGVVAAKQQRLPRLIVHCSVVTFGILLAFWQTAGVFYGGNLGGLAHGIQRWVGILTTGGAGDDDSIFLLFIVALGFLLSYTSAWLLYRTRSPWLLIVANAVVMLINLSNVDAGYVIFLVVFLVASLLLVLRFNLYESVRRWQRLGLRYADDIGWDVMQAGALISIGILIVSWILPWGYTDPLASQIWNAKANPFIQLENTWNRVISLNGGATPANHGNFRDTLILAGNPNLTHEVVMTVQSDDGSQYLGSLAYENYTGRGWINSAPETFTIKANQDFAVGSTQSHAVKQKITLVNPPGGQSPYILGALDISSTSLPANVLVNPENGNVQAWVKQNGNFTAGTTYTVVSQVSSADTQTLRTVPFPKDAPSYPSAYDGPRSPLAYNPDIVKVYTALPRGLDPHIGLLSKELTATAPTMYDKAAALENYLRSNFKYNVNIQLPAGEEGVSWFLFRSNHEGFCNYFATTMAVMARSVGIPARVVVGYTNGENDPNNHQHVIHGSDAHAWTQVYFAGYGWVNFEPSASFSTFARPLPNQFPSVSSGGSASGTDGAAVSPNLKGKKPLDREQLNEGDGSSTSAATGQAQLQQGLGITLGSLILLLLFCSILFMLWWQRLFRRYDPAVQLYGRICMLANWAGIRIQPAQTPYEYMQTISTYAPEEATLLERVGDIYVRDLWADPQSPEHPRRNGEIQELPAMWQRLQPRLFFYVIRHPHFLRWLPQRLGLLIARFWHWIRTKRSASEEL